MRIGVVTALLLDLMGTAPAAADDPIPGSVAAATTITEILQAYDYTDADADTLRLYRAFLNRDPDPAGAVYWIGQSRLGADPDDLAYGFAQSDEFRARYGTLTNDEFLTLLYDNMLGRVPDQAGFDYWLGQMNDGLSQHGVVRWIVANDEFKLRFPFAPVPPSDPGDAVNCSDFSTQSDAQAWHDHYFDLHGGDIANLDGDGDGFACNGLR